MCIYIHGVTMKFLKEAELSAVIDMIKCGIEPDSAYAELAVRYMPMMRGRVLSMFSDADEIAEAMQEAHIALHNAALTYDADKCSGVTFGLYAGVCVCNRLKSYLRRLKSESAKLDKFSEAEESRADCDVESFIATRDACQRVMSVAEGVLSEYEYCVFRLQFEGYTTRDIALKLGKTPKSVDNAKSRISKRLSSSSEIRSILAE